jgi:hypothetical protein
MKSTRHVQYYPKNALLFYCLMIPSIWNHFFTKKQPPLLGTISCSAPLAKSIVMIFSATLFSKWRIHGIACCIEIIAASFPSSPLCTASEI